MLDLVIELCLDRNIISSLSSEQREMSHSSEPEPAFNLSLAFMFIFRLAFLP